MAKLHHAQREAHSIAHNNLLQARESNAPTARTPTSLQFQAGDKVWVKINNYGRAQPKLMPEGKAGIIIERLSDSTYNVLRHGRNWKKKVTLNVTQIRCHHSHHPADPSNNDTTKEDEEDKTPARAEAADL